MGSEDSTCMKRYKPYLVMLFIQFVYAGMALFSKASINDGMNPAVFVVYRQVIATLVLAPFAYIFERKKASSLSFILVCKIFFISLFGITLSLNLYCVALKYTTATFAAASTNTIPAITFVMAVVLRMESVSARHAHGMAKVLGSVLCFSGALVVALYKGPPIWYSESHREALHSSTGASSSKVDWVKGSFLMIAANTAWSMWLVLQAPILQSFPAKLLLTAMQCFFSSIQSALLAVLFERNPAAWKLGWNINLLSVTYCGIIVTGISYWLQVWCISKKGPVFTAVFTPLALVITAVFSTFIWKERLYWGSCGGAALLVAGLYCVLWGKRKEEQKTSTKNEQQLDIHEETGVECTPMHSSHGYSNAV